MTDETEVFNSAEEEQYAKAIAGLEGDEPEETPEETEVVKDPVQDPETTDEAEPTEEPAPVTTDEPFDGFDELPEDKQKAILAAIEARDREANERIQQAEQRWKAQHGQLAPVQQQAARLLEENRALQEKLATGRKPDTERYDILKAQFAEDFPEDAAALEAYLGPLTEANERTRQENEQIRAQLDEALGTVRKQNEIGALSQAHPDWQEHVPYIDKWIDLLDPVEYEQAAQWRSSSSANDNIKLMNMYKRDRQIAQMYLSQEQGKPATPAAQKKPRNVDPNPRNRQSSPRASNAPSSAEEEAYIAALIAAEKY